MSIRRKRKKKDTNSKKYSFEKRMFCCSNGLYLRLAGVTSGLKAEGKQMIYIQVVWEATGGRRTASMRKVADREKTRAFRKKGKQSIGRQAIGRQETCWQATEISTASRHVLGRKANIKQKYRTVERHVLLKWTCQLSWLITIKLNNSEHSSFGQMLLYHILGTGTASKMNRFNAAYKATVAWKVPMVHLLYWQKCLGKYNRSIIVRLHN